ncbi:MAG TPA: hypothetical protein ENG33_02235 [Chloroflexi bacterium]|nr:hypothetical protein [Chloroflexota bacterium]
MKYYRLILGLVAICLLLSMAACGPKEPIIETPAKEMNLSAEDLGSGWKLDAEQNYDEMGAEVKKYFKDGNFRSFSLEEKGMALSQVVCASTVSLVQKAVKEADPMKMFMDGLKQDWPEATTEIVEAPDIGEEPSLGKLSLSMEGGITLNAWVLIFRKANVLALVSLIGAEDFATKELITEYGRKLEAKIQ